MQHTVLHYYDACEAPAQEALQRVSAYSGKAVAGAVFTAVECEFCYNVNV